MYLERWLGAGTHVEAFYLWELYVNIKPACVLIEGGGTGSHTVPTN